MSNQRFHLMDVVRHEFQLPEIDADICVHSLFESADCQACVDACPSQAWVLDDSALGIDTEACDGCGLCVPACPSAALSIHFPWVIRPFGGRMIALFACEKSCSEEKSAIIPCIHALGLQQLLLLNNSGIEYLLFATGECEACSRHQQTGIYENLQQLNNLLHERKKPPLKILERSFHVWEKIFATEEMIPRGTQLSRRNFLRGGSKQLRQQMVVLDPLNLRECQTMPAGQLLPAAADAVVHWPWVPRLDETRCTGCDACTRLCPTEALQLKSDKENASSLAYQINAANCNGCGICTSVCESAAISIHRWSLAATNKINLTENHCRGCGNPFHFPENISHSKQTFCRICKNHNHSSKLFQVLA